MDDILNSIEEDKKKYNERASGSAEASLKNHTSEMNVEVNGNFFYDHVMPSGTAAYSNLRSYTTVVNFSFEDQYPSKEKVENLAKPDSCRFSVIDAIQSKLKVTLKNLNRYRDDISDLREAIKSAPIPLLSSSNSSYNSNNGLVFYICQSRHRNSTMTKIDGVKSFKNLHLSEEDLGVVSRILNNCKKRDTDASEVEVLSSEVMDRVELLSCSSSSSSSSTETISTLPMHITIDNMSISSDEESNEINQVTEFHDTDSDAPLSESQFESFQIPLRTASAPACLIDTSERYHSDVSVESSSFSQSFSELGQTLRRRYLVFDSIVFYEVVEMSDHYNR